jgi:hypothetical protein
MTFFLTKIGGLRKNADAAATIVLMTAAKIRKIAR